MQNDLLQAKLPTYFTPVDIELIRIGSKHDGGYLLPEKMLQNFDTVLSLGANNDINFELELNTLGDYTFFIVDKSASTFGHFKSAVKCMLHFNLIPSVQYVKAIFQQSLLRYLDNKFHFIYEFCGNLEGHISLTNIIDNEIGSSGRLLLSCDIEGHEYRILNEIIAFQDRLEVVVIEFHDCDTHMKEITRFIQNFDLNICHIHANNCGSITKLGVPTTLEITFGRASENMLNYQLPRDQDMPCDPKRVEIQIQFGR